MKERREGPTPSLFPLTPRSVTMADMSLRYVDSNFTENERKDYIIDVFSKAPPSLRRFLDRKALELPLNTFSHVLYRYGNTVAIDSAFLECVALVTPRIRVKKSDIRNFEAIRDILTGPDWYYGAGDRLQKILLSVNDLLEQAEPSLKPIMDQVLESETPDTSVEMQLQRKLGYLLGIADGYFPLRLAYMREHMPGRLD